jgi:uncharacterized protein YcaQ
MRKNDRDRAFSAQDAARFRLQRHCLVGCSGASVVSLAQSICGAQAQIMSAAYLQFWARNHRLRRRHVESALWQKRSLIKTHLMRQTLHLIPAAEFALYISALRNCRVADALRVMGRFGITPEEGHSLTPLVLEAVSRGPAGRAEITAAVRGKVSKRMQSWMDRVWSILRIPMAEGLLCYGPGEGNEVALVRTDHWFKKQQPLGEETARMELLRKYLGTYGPATLADFAHWAGLPAPQVRPLRAALGEELCEVSLDGRPSLLLRKDLRSLGGGSPSPGSTRLLPHFDPYLLAHREKDHLLASRYYKSVYRNQGWISPVVLVDGSIAGTWSHKASARRLQVSIEAFAQIPRTVRADVAGEAETLAEFFGVELERITFA